MFLHSGFSVYHLLRSILCYKRPKETVYPSLQHVFFSSDEGLCKTRNVWPCFAFLFSRSDLARGPPSINTVAVTRRKQTSGSSPGVPGNNSPDLT
ncbi:hypothetical protein MRB53_006161 [Persea americana]|uniref:Uncharacterized protein n=1 Tax=Persea americana TaxID=3435 RepID=A0ACC2MGA0_PERAE|nr:hypothetical protein MRB53_006161 [Persea americana]